MIPVLFVVLPRLHSDAAAEVSMWLVIAGALALLLSVSGFVWVLLAPSRFFRDSDLGTGFLTAHALIVGFGTAPVLWGFLAFFIVESIWPFTATAAVAIVLLGIGRPSESFVSRWGERLGPPVTPTSLWAAVLRPE